MDENKRAKMDEVGYKIQATCGSCVFANLSADGYGTCEVHEYFHGKHQETRKLSIHRSGVCPRHTVSYVMAEFAEWPIS